MEQRYLRKKDDTRSVIPFPEFWLWTEILAQRDDMVEFSGPPISEVPKDGIRVPNAQVVPTIESVDDLELVEEVFEVEEDTLKVDPNRITAIVAAIRKMDPKKHYTKKTPQRPAMPRIDSIEKMTGFSLEQGERELALEEMKTVAMEA